MFTLPPRIFLYTDSLMPGAAPRGSLFIAPRAADTNSGLTSIRALRMSFCKVFWVLGFVERAASSTFCCSRMIASFTSSPIIHLSHEIGVEVYHKKTAPRLSTKGGRKILFLINNNLYNNEKTILPSFRATQRIVRPPKFYGSRVLPVSCLRCSPSAGIVLAFATWAFPSQ